MANAWRLVVAIATLVENHPDAKKVALSDEIYTYASHYLPLVKQYVPGWRRSLLTAREEADGWKITVDFESS